MDLPLQISIATRLRLARIERGFSQRKLGDDIGVSGQQIFKYETARSSITAPRLAEIARALNRPLSFFYDSAKLPGGEPLDRSSQGRLTLLHAYDKLDEASRVLLISIANSLADAAGRSATT